MGILITIFGIGIGLIYIKIGREHKEALAEVREANKEARQCLQEIRHVQDKATEKMEKIDSLVESKLQQIEKQGQKSINKLLHETERQRRIAELWNKGIREVEQKNYLASAACWKELTDIDPQDHGALNNWGNALSDLARNKTGDEADALFAHAAEKFQKALDIKPDDHETFHNWGNVLSNQAKIKTGEEADELFAQAAQKFQKAVDIKPDYYEAFHNWGTALLEQAKTKTGDEADALFAQAREKCLTAEKIKRGYSAYDLACIAALTGDPDQCRQWLQVGEEEGTIQTREHAEKDTDLDSVRDEDWFQQIRWKGEK